MPLINGKFEPLCLPEKHARVLFDNSRKWRYRCLWGGRNGAKDWSMAAAVIEIAVRTPKRILCTREVQNTIADSIKKLLEDTISRLGYAKYFDITKDGITGINGTAFMFRGLKDMNAENLKSIEGVDIVILGEAQSLTKNSWDILNPTIRKPGSEIWIQFNQKLETDFVYERFVKSPYENAIVENVNYLDHPYCSQEILDQAEQMKKEDLPMYRHIWLSDCSPVGTFFSTFGKHMKIDPYQIVPGIRLYGSLDHGTTAPTSFGFWVLNQDKKPVRLMSYYKPGLSASENAYGIANAIQAFPFTGGQPPEIVWADPSMWTKQKLDKDYQPAAIEYYEAAFKDVFKEASVKTRFVKGNNDVRNGCVVMKEMFGQKDGVPNSFYFDQYNKAYEDLIPQQQHDKYDVEIYDTKLEDHIADDTRYFATGIRGIVRSEPKGKVVDYNQQLVAMSKQGLIGDTGI